MALLPLQVGIEQASSWGKRLEPQASLGLITTSALLAHRYVPVGLLERLPQRINERPPYYLGRDYLETLMASQQAADWIRIRYPLARAL